MKYFVTGGAGFVGSNLVDQLLSNGHTVAVYDNYSTGKDCFLDKAKNYQSFELTVGDLLDLPALTSAMHGCNFVYHMAANADVRFGLVHPRKDLEQNTIGTFNVLESMRANEIMDIAFASTGSIYGEPTLIPTPENCPFPVQTSLYGASKLSSEALIEAYCAGFGFRAFIFRFVGVLGERYTHGHVIDFYNQLKCNPSKLHVLGDGHQKKSYIYVQDCIEAMLIATRTASDQINIFNLGLDEFCQVNDSVHWITEHLGLRPNVSYAGGRQGWVGDNPFIYLDTTKIRNLGWKPKLTIRESIVATVRYLCSSEANA